MRCPKCGTELPEGRLYCEKCGEEIHIVPDYDPSLDLSVSVVEEDGDNMTDEAVSPPKPIRKPGVIFLRGIIAVLGLAVIVLIIVVQVNLKHFQSAEYQIEQAKKYQSMGEYDRAIECYSRAADLKGDNVELYVQLAEIYYLKNDQATYEVMLRNILSNEYSTQEQIESAQERLIPLLIKKGDFEGICRLLQNCKNAELVEKYKEYLAPKPEFSLVEGTYEGIQSLSIKSSAEGAIYYTLDGTVPGVGSTPYTMSIVLDEGTTTVKACLINAYGVKSEIAERTFVIEAPRGTVQ